MNTPILDRRALLLGTLALLAGCGRSQAGPVPDFKGANLADKGYGNDFRLKDTQGKERTLADWHGKVVLLHFGFTQCPDACPTMLARAAEVRKMLGAQKDKLQVLFVTLDPERDTPQRLAGYVTFFHPRLIGLTGDMRAIAQAARAYKVYYAKVATANGYTIDHSGYVYLMDRAGRYLGFFPPGTPPERMVEVIRPYLEAN
jgi:protein SCO1/2